MMIIIIIIKINAIYRVLSITSKKITPSCWASFMKNSSEITQLPHSNCNNKALKSTDVLTFPLVQGDKEFQSFMRSM